MDIEVREMIVKIREEVKRQHLSYQNVTDLVCSTGHFVSRSTVKRVLSADLNTCSFRYQETVKPIAETILDHRSNDDGIVHLCKLIVNAKPIFDLIYNQAAKIIKENER